APGGGRASGAAGHAVEGPGEATGEVTAPPLATTARVTGRRSLAPGIVATTLEAPEIAAAAAPLQFVQVRLPAGGGGYGSVPGRPFLGRPFSIYDADAGSGRLTIVYRVVGPGTEILAGLEPGATVELLGPLGRPVPVVPSRPGAPPALAGPLWLVAWSWKVAVFRLLAVRALAAGIPVTVLLAAEGEAARVLAADWAPLVPPAPGARPGEPPGLDPGEVGGHLAIVPPAQLPSFLAAALDRDDTGGNGMSGVTDPSLDGAAGFATTGAGSQRPRLFAAGPRPFLQQVQRIVRKHPVDAFLVVDAYMPCGYGACLGCAVPVRDGAGTRYVRACREGRWFAAGEVIL
ncbi:MAG: hypothetical protein DIU69_01280, partial [Bacillota bacterium]